MQVLLQLLLQVLLWLLLQLLLQTQNLVVPVHVRFLKGALQRFH